MKISPQWQVDRGLLNHNWLQNGVLVALNHALNVASGKVRARDVKETLIQDIHRWQERQAELTALLGRFEEEMSPNVLFEQIPLSRLSPETRNWLLPLAHHLWLLRTGAGDKIHAAMVAFREAAQAFRVVDSALIDLNGTPTSDNLRLVSVLLQAFIERADNLAESISALPSRILCS
jgi:hypothetical protein